MTKREKIISCIQEGRGVLGIEFGSGLIHAPTKSLQQAARDGDNERLNILRDSLGLE